MKLLDSPCYGVELLTTNEVNNKIYSVGIFIDLSKAFDTVDHSLLIKKHQHYGVRGIVANWFVSYLANRAQCVKIDDTSSALLNVSCGVPQGSILGQLLFIIYVNDINNASNIAMFILFADDTNLFLKHPDLNTLYKNNILI